MKYPSDEEIYEWIKNKSYQVEYDENSEYRLLYEIDMPKIFREYCEWLDERNKK